MPTVEPRSAPITPTTLDACPVCRGELRPKLHGLRAPETGATFGVLACTSCGLGRTQPIPADLAPYYDAAYYGNRHGLTARFCRRRRLRWVRRWAGPGAGRSLLDYGCGTGDFLDAARLEGWRSVGIERHVPARAAGAAPIVAGLTDLSGEPIACATFWHVLEHLADPVATLDALRPHLACDGVVLAAVPNLASWQARSTGAAWLALDIPRHLSHFTPKALRSTFEAAGYDVVDQTFGEFEYDLIGWSQSLLNRHCGGCDEFFRVLSGRPRVGTWPRCAAQVGLGLTLTLLAALPTVIESRSGHGGTIVMAARARR